MNFKSELLNSHLLSQLLPKGQLLNTGDALNVTYLASFGTMIIYSIKTHSVLHNTINHVS